MNDQAIDRRLALAIGYPADRVRTYLGCCEVLNDFSRDNSPWPRGGWQRFDHTEPGIAWLIAEKFGKFPLKHIGGGFCCYFWSDGKTTATHRVFICSLVAATASALAVIKYVEGKAHD